MSALVDVSLRLLTVSIAASILAYLAVLVRFYYRGRGNADYWLHVILGAVIATLVYFATLLILPQYGVI